MASLKVLVLSAFISQALSQQTIYGQCAGFNWGGPYTCASGLVCTYFNPYYSQCLPGTASTTSTTLATSTSTSSRAITSSSIKSSTTTSTSTTSAVVSTATGWQYFITFGDSYSQTGFEISLTKATAGNILGNPAFPGYTTTGGDNWIDFLIATLNSTLVLSYNFAYGGATTDASLVAPYTPSVLSFVNQTAEFTSNMVPAPSYAPWTASNALFGIWMGVNDVGNAWYLSNWSTLAQTIIARYMSLVQTMYDSGARNFLFLTVPPIQYTPLVVAEGNTTMTQEGAGVVYYNQLLTAAIATFKSANPGTSTWVFDTTTAFMTAINDPTAFGAPNATCFNADGVSCLWWNNYHPGQAIHKMIAAGIAKMIPGL